MRFGDGIVFSRAHESLHVREPEMSETSMPEKELLLGSGDILIRFVEDRHIGNSMAVARGAWRGHVVGTASIKMARSFGEGDRKLQTRVYRTLKARRIVVSMHPEVVGVTSKLVLRAIETVVLAKILRG